MSGPAPRHLRNPRRAYDADGRLIEPARVGRCRAQGETTVAAYCTACGHKAIVSTDGLPEDLAVPDIALRLRCSACGSKNIGVQIDIEAHYARMKERFGWGGGM